MKKNLFLLLLFIVLLSGCGKVTSEDSDNSDNFYIYTKGSETFNIYVESYDKEYQQIRPEEVLNDISTRRNWDDYEQFEGLYLYNYEEYSRYCKNFYIDKKYDDESSNYIIASELATGWYTANELVDVIIKDDVATLYILEERQGGTTGDVDGYTFIIPVDKNVKNINYEIVNTKEYVDDNFSFDFNIYEQTDDKPVIYLYPKVDTEVSVNLDYNGKLTTTYPKYNNGWNVLAKPDGTLIDDNGQTYNYLYWEGINDVEYDFSKGFCVKGEDTAKFLENSLEKLGLNRKEANEFIVYWLPRMENNEYNIIAFQTDVYTANAKLDIEPMPDTLIRIFMAYYPSDKKIDLEEQNLVSVERNGFVVVEWGGCEISH